VRRDEVAQLFTGAVAPGVYRFTGRIPRARLAEVADQFGWRFFSIDGANVFDKATFLQATAEAMGFPSYYGHNWDAFEEMVNDLSWAPGAGYLLLYDDVARFANNAPSEWTVALDILHHATANWHTQGLPMMVLLRRGGSGLKGLPRL
jgi:hypothetical protein